MEDEETTGSPDEWTPRSEQSAGDPEDAVAAQYDPGARADIANEEVSADPPENRVPAAVTPSGRNERDWVVHVDVDQPVMKAPADA